MAETAFIRALKMFGWMDAESRNKGAFLSGGSSMDKDAFFDDGTAPCR